ncbi:hypothetical protein M7I_6640 [Glarea lozoyensis 74030]|uniref:Uncharacterized protein n=1 Tax=Glarea lozoyensis (strain ATCC 74030 / MF5533) TaxID=1104152 RepID=H0EV47_GLAL7|nr:hypothetical protein M7I_6640 [Glarea lozoyensis 74030]
MAASKRKHHEDGPSQSNKSRARAPGEAYARVDPTYGQRSAIPGLDDETNGDDEGTLNYDEDMDAIAYLRSVREEASGIPNLLVAPKEDKDDGDYESHYNRGDHGAFYGDGAYYATDEHPAQTYEDAETSHDENLIYFDSILTRFEELQAQLLQTPPDDVINALDDDHPTEVGPLNTSLVRWWRWKMKTIEPMPAQVACMNKRGNVLQRGKKIELGLSRWVWGLLAKLPDRGELNSEEIGVVRELGKKAVLVGLGLKDDASTNEGMDELNPSLEDDDEEHSPIPFVNEAETEMTDDLASDALDFLDENDEPSLAAGEQVSIGEDLLLHSMSAGAAETESSAAGSSSQQDAETSSVATEIPKVLTAEELAAAKERMMSTLSASMNDNQTAQEVVTPTEDPQWNTKATVDMILTVAGEIYGQRDLLEFRGIWDQ